MTKIDNIVRKVIKQLTERKVYHSEALTVFTALSEIKESINIYPKDIQNKIMKLVDTLTQYTERYGVYDVD